MKKLILKTFIILFLAVFSTASARGAGDIDLSKIPDGVYKGKCRYYGMFTCEVEVRVRDHRITDIKVFEDRESEYVEQAKGVTKNVIKEQSLKVDTVTGATITSRAILKAIENALAKKGK
ncbi:MAG: FMN-binding protein [Candidatus Omnitrophota bacterium]